MVIELEGQFLVRRIAATSLPLAAKQEGQEQRDRSQRKDILDRWADECRKDKCGVFTDCRGSSACNSACRVRMHGDGLVPSRQELWLAKTRRPSPSGPELDARANKTNGHGRREWALHV